MALSWPLFVRKPEQHLLRDSHRRFREWIVNSLQIGAGALHEYTKTRGVPRQQIAEVFDAQGQKIAAQLAAVGEIDNTQLRLKNTADISICIYKKSVLISI